MKFKKWIAAVIVVAVVFTGYFFINAVPSSADISYSGAAVRLRTLGIMNPEEYGSNWPNGNITRGEFAKALAVASGLDDDAKSMAGPTIFPDVEPGSPLSGYINALTGKKLMPGISDGKFHPEGTINFAQVCTIMLRALGYTDSDLKGTWPKNYILKAKTLGIAGGISLNYMDSLPKWAAAVMIDGLLNTNIKKANPADPDKTYAEASGILKDSYQFALISDPVYSEPQIVSNFDPKTSYRIGSISLGGDVRIVRNGKLLSTQDIEDNDVVYEVTDVWRTKRYILVVDNKVSGEITSISPKSIQIDNKDYLFSRVGTFSQNLGVGDYATVLLGYDGKVVDFFDIPNQDNSNFAFVVNHTSDVSGYMVKLLMIDGSIRTFKSSYYVSKGNLVTYSKIDDETVSLSSVGYNYPGDVTINKETRKIGDSYVANNVKIFNLISNPVNGDVSVELVRWSDLPSGLIPSDRVLYINKSGDFNDVNVMVITDAFSQGYKTGIVKNITYKIVKVPQGIDPITGKPLPDLEKSVVDTYTILIDGKDYTWRTEIGASVGSVLKVKMSGSIIDSIQEVRSSYSSASEVEAIDVSRIKINGTIYEIKGSPAVFFRNWDGSFSLKSIEDIEVAKDYSSVSIYLDRPVNYGGKVDAIVVW